MEGHENTSEQHLKKKRSYSEVLRMIAETTAKCQKTLESCDKSITTLDGSMQSIASTRVDMQEFCSEFSTVMKGFCNKIAETFSPITPVYRDIKLSQIYGESKVCSVVDCVEMLKKKKNILFITGQGISGDNLSSQMLKESPELFWESYISKIKPFQNQQNINNNKGSISSSKKAHQKLHELIQFLPQNQVKQYSKLSHFQLLLKNQKQIIATEDIDGFHRSQTQVDVFEICGNKDYLRCEQSNCPTKEMIFILPESFNSYKELVCGTCQSQARPHFQCEDEGFSEIFYKSDTLRKIASNQIDLIVCLGASLQSQLGRLIVSEAVENWVPIVEINNNPIISVGGLTIKGSEDEILMKICQQFNKVGINNQKMPQGQQNILNSNLKSSARISQKANKTVISNKQQQTANKIQLPKSRDKVK